MVAPVFIVTRDNQTMHTMHTITVEGSVSAGDILATFNTVSRIPARTIPNTHFSRNGSDNYCGF